MAESRSPNTSKPRRKVLITRARIDETAVKYLDDEGFDCFFSPPYEAPHVVSQKAAENGIDAIMVSQGKITREVIEASPSLRVIVKHGSGVNNINLIAAERKNIPVYRTPGANARAVAELAITLILSLWKSIPFFENASRDGKWLKSEYIGNNFSDATVGLVGYGAIGKDCAKMARALGFNIAVFDPSLKEAPEGAQFFTNLNSMVSSVDIVSIHCPLTPQTENLISKTQFDIMKNHAVLVNTARGGIVDEDALADALFAGRIAGAALDSFKVEPPDFHHKLWSAPNFIGTHHIGGQTSGAERAMAMGAARIIVHHFEGIEIPKDQWATSSELGGLVEEKNND